MLAERVKTVCSEYGLRYAEQKWLLRMDCYSVHISAEFLTWAKRAYQKLVLLFIPATFTAWLQPLDISFDWVFKALLRRCLLVIIVCG